MHNTWTISWLNNDVIHNHHDSGISSYVMKYISHCPQAFKDVHDKLKLKYFKGDAAAEDKETWPTDYAVKYHNKR